MADETQEELNKFLSNIDDIHRLVQNLSSDDKNDVSKAMQESDLFLKQISKTGVDRTVINKSSSEQQISPNTFMHALEKDAEERAEKRRKNKLLADELKVKGNEAFHQQLYDQAIDYYTQGLNLKKDYDILYTNRAQVYIKQGHYNDAINDCEWALKVTPTFLKAYIIKGKCLMNLKEYDRAKEEFYQAKQIAMNNFESNSTRRMIEECIEEVDKQYQNNQREESARKFLLNENSSQPMNITNTLKKLNLDQQSIIYYIGGIDLLNQLIIDETTRTAFRINHGFNLFNIHPIISENDDENLLNSIFNLIINLSNDDENAKQCLESKLIKNYLKKTHFSSMALQYFIEISLKISLRNSFLQKILLNNFISYLMNIINENQSHRIYAIQLLSNLAIESRIKQYFNNNQNELNKIILILKFSSNDQSFQNRILSFLTNLCTEKTIRLYLINQINIFQILIDNFHIEYELNFLNLLINLTNEKNENLEKFSKNLLEFIFNQLKNLIHYQRILMLLGNILMHYEQLIDIFNQYKIIPWISQLLQQNSNEEIIRAGIRLLALCTQSNQQAQEIIANDTKLLSLIYEQLITSKNSLLIGNICLLFEHIIYHSSIRIFLQKTKIISQILKLIEQSWLTKPARKNLAIFLTKLVKTDENFLQEFRQQHGTEILHSALKDVEL